jgi:hypothetical protein
VHILDFILDLFWKRGVGVPAFVEVKCVPVMLGFLLVVVAFGEVGFVVAFVGVVLFVVTAFVADLLFLGASA